MHTPFGPASGVWLWSIDEQAPDRGHTGVLALKEHDGRLVGVSFTEVALRNNARLKSVVTAYPLLGSAEPAGSGAITLRFEAQSGGKAAARSTAELSADGQGWTVLYRSEGPVAAGQLIEFNTRTVPRGSYQLRLMAVDKTGNYGPPCTVALTVQ